LSKLNKLIRHVGQALATSAMGFIVLFLGELAYEGARVGLNPAGVLLHMMSWPVLSDLLCGLFIGCWLLAIAREGFPSPKHDRSV
jgi:hypothetical protein